MNNWLLLLVPRFFALRNGFLRQGKSGWVRASILLLFMALFWGGTFWFFSRTLSYFLTIPDFGPTLNQKLLSMIFLTFFAILLFSNVITGLSTFFLSRDLLLLVPAPVPPGRLFAAKFVETLVDSSWMVLLFSAPVFLAYGVVHGGGPMYYLMTFLTVVPFLVIPAAIGVIITMALAYALPAQRGKDMLIVFSALFLALLYMLFRLLQPEKLVNPEAFSDFVAFVSAMQMPTSPFLPSTWASEALLPFLGLKTGEPIFYYLLLLSTALMLVVSGAWAATTWYPVGWSKAQEGRRRGGQSQWADTLIRGIARLFPAPLQVSVIKDLKTFCRDTGQWSQLFQLLALIVVYVYNFSVLPRGTGFVGLLDLKSFIAFFNLALAAFVIAAIAIRFVFPTLSLEGKTFWVLKSAPLHLRRWWWSKFWVALLPLLVLGEVLAVITNYFLDVSTFMMILAPVTLAFLTFALVALGMAFGIAYPNFTAEHIAKIPASFGGLLYMAFSIVFIGVIVVLEALPVHISLLRSIQHIPMSSGDWYRISLSFGVAFSLVVILFVGATRWSIQRLEEMEISL